MIGPSTFLPGVTMILPFPSISAGTSLPSSSLADTFVSLSGLFTFTPVSCLSSVGLTGFLPVSSTDVFLSSGVVSEPLSSRPFLWPSTGTSTLTFPPGMSGSSTVTVIGPSTFLPGVTMILPFPSISAGTSLPSSSLADTFVSLSGLFTFTPVYCLSSVGLTGFLPVSSTDVFLSAGVVSVTVTGTFTSTFSPFGNVTVTTAVLSPVVDTSGSVFIATVDPSGRFLIFSLYWSSVG